MERLRQRWSQLVLPLYAHHGAQDSCTSLPATAAFVKASASADKVGGRPPLRARFRGCGLLAWWRTRAPCARRRRGGWAAAEWRGLHARPRSAPAPRTRRPRCCHSHVCVHPAHCLGPQTFYTIEGGYHEVMFGPGSEAVVARLADWVLQHAGGGGTQGGAGAGGSARM